VGCGLGRGFSGEGLPSQRGYPPQYKSIHDVSIKDVWRGGSYSVMGVVSYFIT